MQVLLQVGLSAGAVEGLEGFGGVKTRASSHAVSAQRLTIIFNFTGEEMERDM